MSTFALRFNKNCEMTEQREPSELARRWPSRDGITKNSKWTTCPKILQYEFDTLESLCYNFGTEPKEIKNYLFGHGFVYSEKQKQFRPIGYDKVTR